MKMLAKAFAIAGEAFKGTLDRGGKPYILHCITVMGDVDDETEAICGLLHDLLEDTNWTPEMLRAEGFSEEVISILLLLKHNKDVDTYDSYIKKLAFNPIAKRIKKRDLRHNSDISRLKGLRQKDFDRIEQYHRAYVYLS